MNLIKLVSHVINKVIQFLGLPTFLEDDDESRIAYRLSVVSIVGIFLTLLYTIIWLVILPEHLARLVFVAPTLIVFVTTIALVRMRHVHIASNLMVAGGWILVTLITASAGGTQAPFFGFYILIILIAVLFSSWRTAVFFAIITILVGIAMVIFADSAWIGEPFASPMSAWLTQTTVMVFVAANAYIILRDIQQSLHKAQQSLAEREQADATLRESEERFKALVAKSSDMVTILNVDGIITFQGESVKQILGFNPGDMVGESGFDYVHPDDVSRAQAAFAEDIDQIGAEVSMEYRFRRADDSWVHLESRATNRLHDPAINGIVVNSRDVTERKAIEEALRLTQHTVDKSRIPILWVRPDASIMYANEAQCAQLGYSRAELTAMRVSDFDLEWTVEYWSGVGWERIKSEGQWTFESRIRRKDGTVFPAEITATYGKFMEQEYVFAFVTDITRRKHLENEAREAEILRIELEKERELAVLKDRFVSMVSHEFRTPLTVIRVSSDLLLHYYDRLDEAKRVQKLQHIQEQITHLTELIDSVLLSFRTQSGKTELNPSPLDFALFCRNIFEQVQFIDSKDHQFEFVSSTPDKSVMLDANPLQHILTNLLSNAVKYSPPGSQIKLELDHNDSGVTLRVSDEGIGIPEKDLPRLFDPFHRAENVGSAQGTGLGLSIVRDYVELCGGAINVESVVGKGSTFTVQLPLAFS